METKQAKRIPVAPNAGRCAAAFGCSVEQAKRLLGKNAEGLAEMADKAANRGKKVNGYAESELRASAKQYDAASR